MSIVSQQSHGSRLHAQLMEEEENPYDNAAGLALARKQPTSEQASSKFDLCQSLGCCFPFHTNTDLINLLRKKAQNGSYAFRPCSQYGNFTLFVKAMDQVFSCKIECSKRGYMVAEQDDQFLFHSMDDLIQYHRQKPISLKDQQAFLRLKYPLLEKSFPVVPGYYGFSGFEANEKLYNEGQAGSYVLSICDNDVGKCTLQTICCQQNKRLCVKKTFEITLSDDGRELRLPQFMSTEKFTSISEALDRVIEHSKEHFEMERNVKLGYPFLSSSHLLEDMKTMTISPNGCKKSSVHTEYQQLIQSLQVKKSVNKNSVGSVFHEGIPEWCNLNVYTVTGPAQYSGTGTKYVFTIVTGCQAKDYGVFWELAFKARPSTIIFVNENITKLSSTNCPFRFAPNKAKERASILLPEAKRQITVEVKKSGDNKRLLDLLLGPPGSPPWNSTMFTFDNCIKEDKNNVDKLKALLDDIEEMAEANSEQTYSVVIHDCASKRSGWPMVIMTALYLRGQLQYEGPHASLDVKETVRYICPPDGELSLDQFAVIFQLIE